MSYLRYLCLFANSGVQHILCCVFGLFVFVLCCQFLWIVHFRLQLRYSLMFFFIFFLHICIIVSIRIIVQCNVITGGILGTDA